MKRLEVGSPISNQVRQLGRRRVCLRLEHDPSSAIILAIWAVEGYTRWLSTRFIAAPVFGSSPSVGSRRDMLLPSIKQFVSYIIR